VRKSCRHFGVVVGTFRLHLAFLLIGIACVTSSVFDTCHYLELDITAFQTQSLGLETDGKLRELTEWFASPCEVMESVVIEDTLLDVSETEPFEYAATPPKFTTVGQRPRTPDLISPEHFEDAQESTAPGDVNMSVGVDLLATPDKHLKKDDASWSPTMLDSRFGMNTARGQPAATATAAAAAADIPPLPDPTLTMIMKTMADIAASTHRLESSGTRLEQKLEHHVSDLSDRLEAGLKLNRDETGQQIAGLRKHMLDLQAQQQKQQVDFTEKLAGCTSSSSAPFDRAELKKEIVQ
jgi:hypothetical protein